jgi:hypothetical protein
MVSTAVREARGIEKVKGPVPALVRPIDDSVKHKRTACESHAGEEERIKSPAELFLH